MSNMYNVSKIQSLIWFMRLSDYVLLWLNRLEFYKEN